MGSRWQVAVRPATLTTVPRANREGHSLTKVRQALLVLMGATALLLVAAGTGGAQGTCPPGQTGNPPYCQTAARRGGHHSPYCH